MENQNSECARRGACDFKVTKTMHRRTGMIAMKQYPMILPEGNVIRYF
jgi:hypothetical protein